MAKLINKNSKFATSSELSIFEIPETQLGIVRKSWLEVPLRNALTKTGPYEFVVQKNPQFLQLSQNYLLLECRILDSNGIPITARIDDPGNPGQQIDANWVGPINLFAKTFIKQMQVSLNGTQIYDSNTNYAYRAYLETELMYGQESKTTHLATAGYTIESEAMNDTTNEWFQNRARPFRNGNYVQLAAPLHCDLFMQDKLMIPGVELRVTLYPNSDNFNLMNSEGEQYSLEFSSLKLYVLMVEVLKNVSLSIEKNLLKTTAKYPLKRVVVYDMYISANRRTIPRNDLFSSNIPRRLIIGCVNSNAFHGDITCSPFNFENFNLRDIYVTAGNVKYPNVPLEPHFDQDNFVRAYMQLLQGLGYYGGIHGNLITPNKFKSGWCLYCFDLSTSADDNVNWEVAREGSTELFLDFKDPIPDPGVTLIVYAEFDSMLSIDQYRNCFLDYKV